MSARRRPDWTTEHETESESDTEFTESEQVVAKGSHRFQQNSASSRTATPSRQSRTGLHPLLEAQKPWSSKIRAFRLRSIWTLILVVSFFFLLALGHLYCSMLLLITVGGIYGEVIAIKRNVEKDKRLPLFFCQRWYFFGCTIFLVGGKWAYPLCTALNIRNSWADMLGEFHLFVSFTALTAGLCAFVLTLRKFTIRYQFKQLAMILLTLLVVVVNSLSMIANIYNGLIWFVLPASLVVVNDVFAYLFGVFFGRTRLIALSPKKTWEGFIGASVVTLLWAVLCSVVLQHYSWFICPQEKITFVPFDYTSLQCETSSLFIPRRFFSPTWIAELTRVSAVEMSPMTWHSILLGFFAAIIAPFGGFFASGVKRAFKIKDFGGSIPGHGGLTDRFDCQILMGIFTYIYYYSFVYNGRVGSIEQVFTAITALSAKDQMELMRRVHTLLDNKSF